MRYGWRAAGINASFIFTFKKCGGVCYEVTDPTVVAD
jgi:hypothetical protein